MNEPNPARKITPDDLDLFISSGEEEDEELIGYLNAAAVLAAFDPFRLRPVGGNAVRKDTTFLDRLLPRCEPITQGSGRGFWRLLLPDRRGALRRLSTRDSMQHALEANLDRPEIGLQLIFERLVAGEQIVLSEASRGELADLLIVHDWLDGILSNLPNRAAITRAMALSDLLAPMHRLADANFVGRERELNQLAKYVLGRETSVLEDALIASGRRPPLFVHGPGGVGKSTLLARFILDQAATRDIHTVYIDMDRPTVRPDSPATLLLDAITQLQPQIDADPTPLDGLAKEISYFIGREDARRHREARELQASLLRQFKSVIEPLLGGSVLLIVIDTFEEAQFLGSDVVWALLQFFLNLTATLPDLRLIILGRTLPDEFLSLAFPRASNEVGEDSSTSLHTRGRIPMPYRPMDLGVLDKTQARKLLRSSADRAGLPHLRNEYLDDVIRVVSRNPMCLKLAARLLVDEGGGNLTAQSEFMAKLKAEKIQALLYGRILGHLHTDELRAVAHPGLIVRRITPSVIRDVLAGPCGLEINSGYDEHRIFEALRREAALVEVDPEDGSLRHRADVRRTMLEDVVDQVPPEVVEWIDRNAVAFYEQRSDPVSRSEEIYHRLRLSEPRENLEARWIPEAASRLKSAGEELPAQQRLWLAAQLGVTVDESVRGEASQEAWEDQAARSAERYLLSGTPDKALRILEERTERLPRSTLFFLHAEALRLLGQPDAALQVARGGIDAANKAGAIEMALELLLQTVVIEEGTGNNDSAARLFVEANAVASYSSDAMLRFRVKVTELRLLRKRDPDAIEKMAALRRDALGGLTEDLLRAMRAQPALLREAAAELGEEDPRIVSMAIETLGVEAASDEQAEALGNAIVTMGRASRSRRARTSTFDDGSLRFQDTGLDADVIRSWAAGSVTGRDVRTLASSLAGTAPGTETLRDFRDYFRAAEPNPLVELFRQCVVRVNDGTGAFRGTGFFVAPGRVLTCAHVVSHVQGIEVTWRDRRASAIVADAAPPLDTLAGPESRPLPDLALLDLAADGQGWDHPCARLTGDQPFQGGSAEALYLAGYTTEDAASPVLTGATTEFESVISERRHTFYKLKRGHLLPGFSGSPLLNLRTGAVAGIVESGRTNRSGLGGFAVPIQAAATAFPDMFEANQNFHLADARWMMAVEAELARAAERAGSRARLPLRPPVIPLELNEDVSAAKLLRPRHAVVGYVGRQQLLHDLARWCEIELADEDTTELWFVTGSGGFGKTRLAVEACLEAEARGWTAGLLTPGVSEDKLEVLANWQGRLLVGIDYAETQPALVGRMVQELAARSPRPPARIMLLVRRQASRTDLRAIFNDQREEQLDELLRRAPISRLGDAGSEVDRLQLFNRAAEDFGIQLGMPPAPLTPPRLRAAHFAQPLYVLTAAFLKRMSADADVDALTEADLLRVLLDEHEADHWDRWAKRRRLHLDPSDQRAAVAVATLLGASGEPEALTVARLVPHHGDEPESRLRAIARWLAKLYPTAAGEGQFIIAPLEPDRLGEVLIEDVLRQHSDLLAAAIDTASNRQLSQALIVAGRIAHDNPAVCAQLRLALDERLGDLLQRGFGADGDELLTAVVSAMTTARPVRGALEAADRFPTVLPVWLQPLAATLTSLAAEGLRTRVHQDPAALPDLARALSSLAARLSDVGRREEALTAAQEAVSHYQQLAQASPASYLPDLAMSLNNLAARLGEAGRREEALTAAQESVALRRQLAEASPAAYLPDLAMSLNNLAVRLGEAGRREEALTAAQESVALRRQLAEASPAAYLPDLARALNNLAARLGEAGRREEALTAAQEAVSHYQQLAQASPASYLPDLAMSLNNLAARLGEAGRREEALTAAQESVALRRQLAEASPAAYLPDLAMSLNNLAVRLGEAGRREEALTAAQEAVSHYQQLAQASPAAYLPDLARALNNLAARLGEAGRREEALTAAQESVALRRQLAQDSPASYLPDLARALNNLGLRLGEAGRREEALTAAQEAVSHYQQLAQASPAAYLPDLARALNNLAARLGEAGRREEALTAAQEAVSHYQQLAQASPAAYLPHLAMSLNNLAARLGEAGRREEALTAAQEAVSHYQQLAQASPAAYLPHLAMSLNNLGLRLGEAGRREEALTAAQEAVSHYQQLAQASPAAYLPDLAQALNNVANWLSEAGRVHEAEESMDDMLSQFAGSPLGRGHILLARGNWESEQNRLEQAVYDLSVAVSALNDAGDRFNRGRARQLLRDLRIKDRASFDDAWTQTHVPLPVWLEYPTTDEELAVNVIAWVSTPDWTTSKTYLDEHAAALLTDNAEAALQHLIDYDPAVETLQDHLDLLLLVRAEGIDAAYAAHQEKLITARLSRTLEEWMETPTWADSQAFAVDRSDELLHPVSISILDSLGDQNPDDQMLRLHRGLLTYAATAGFDTTYELRADANRRRSALAASDPTLPDDCRLALARLDSGQSDDDPEAHFQLAVTAMLLSNAREAAAALTDCADNAAPYERRDFAHRLGELSSEHPELAELTAELEQILDTRRHTDSGH